MDDISKKLDFFEQNGRLPDVIDNGFGKIEEPVGGGNELKPENTDTGLEVKEEMPVVLETEDDGPLDGLKRLWVHRALSTKAEVDKEKETIAKSVEVPVSWLDNEQILAEAREAAGHKQRLERLFPNGVGEDALATLYKEYPWIQKVKGLSDEEGPKVILEAANLHKAYGFIPAVKAGWKSDELRNERGGFGFEKMLSGDFNDADREKVKELDAKIKDVPRLPGLFEAPLENTIGGYVSSIKAMARQAVFGGTAAAAAVGSIAGITAGGIAGVAASGVDGITTSGITLAARIAAGRASLTAASKAVPYGMAAKMFQEEAGNYYLDFLGYKDKDGKQLMSNDEAATYAVAAGLVQTVIEYANFDIVMNVLRRNVKGKALKEVEKVLAGAKTGSTALARIKQLFKDKGLDWAKVTGTEAGEEAVQSLGNDFINRVIAINHPERAEKVDATKGIDEKGIVPKLSFPEMGSRAVENFIESVGVTSLFGATAVGGSLHSGVRRVARVLQAEQVLGQDRMRTIQGIEMVNKLNEFYQTNELAKESPELVDKVVKAQLDGTGFENVYVDTELVKKEEGGEKTVEILEQAAINSGMTEEEVKASRETGGGLVLPASSFAKLDPEVAKKLDRFVSFSESSDCLAVVQNRAKELQEKVRRIALTEAANVRSGAEKVAKRVTADSEEQSELMQILERYGERFKEGFEKEYDAAVKDRDDFVDGYVEEMAKGMKQGVAFITHEDWTHTYVSNNDRWYSEYVKANKKAPTKAEMRQLVLEAMAGNNTYGIGTYEGELEEAADYYKTLSHRVDVLGSLRGKLDGVDVTDLIASRELSKEGKEVYDKCLALLSKGGKRFKDKGVTSAARGNAMMVALYCDRMAEKWNALAGGKGSINPHTKEQLAVTAARAYQELNGGAKVYTALDYFRTLHTLFNQDLNTVLGGRDTNVWNEEVKPEMDDIRKRYEGTDKWMKAPNGEPTNLTEEQWLAVRTPSFKRWFGDWEKTQRIEKLKNSDPVEFEFNNAFELNPKAAGEYLRKNVRGDYLNEDTKTIIKVFRKGLDEVISHDRYNEEHLKSLAAIPEMIKNSTFIDEMENTKGNGKYDAYKYFVCGIKIDGTDYTAKIVIGVKGDEQYYDHKLSKIEKGSLLDSLDNQSSILEAKPLSDIYDSKLLQVLQTNSSKILDENGEPLVVYHGSNAKFNTFDKTKGRANMDMQGMFFSPWEVDAGGYGENIYPVFLNIKKPAQSSQAYKALKSHAGENGAGVKAREDLIKQGFDGVNNDGEEFIAFDSTQIKSATGNNGSFSQDSGNIYEQSMGKTDTNEKNLIALHNISEEKLAKSLELGGLPMPSIAIMKDGSDFTNFGSITFVVPGEVVNPKNKVDVFSKDAFTVRVPSPEYRAFKDKNLKPWVSKWVPLFKRFGKERYFFDEIVYDLRNYGSMAAIDKFFNHEIVKYGYLTDVLGLDVKLKDETAGAVLDAVYSDEYKKYFTGSDFAKWVSQETESFAGKPVLKVGGKYLDYNLENIVKAMRRKKGRGKENILWTNGAVAAMFSHKFKNIEDMHKHAIELGTRADVENGKEKSEKLITAYCEGVAAYRKDISAFDAVDIAMASLGEAVVNEKVSKEKLKNNLANLDLFSDIPEDVLDLGVKAGEALKNTATEYFEAKPDRAVGINEIVAGILPKDTNKAIVEKLQENGVDVELYDRKQSGDRERALNSVLGRHPDVYFQDNNRVQGQSAIANPRVRTSGWLQEAETDRFIALLKDADATTFFHEFGHICYLDLEAMANNVMATEQMKKDFAVVDGWTAWSPEQLKEYEGTTGYGQMKEIDKQIRESVGRKKEEALRRWKQERWARAVEEYVKKGRVPSDALRRVLADVIKWLKKVYRGLKGAGVPMSKEVRDVMDRMLVAEEMVEAADVRAEVAAFEKAGGLELGSGSAKEMWTKLYDQVHADAEARVRKLAMGDLAEERQKKMAEARTEEREKVLEVFRKKPHFMVQEFLRLNPKLDIGMLCSKAGITVEEYENGLKLDGNSVETAVDKYMREVYEPFLQQEFYASEEDLKAEAEKALGESRYRSILTAFESEMLDKWQRRFERLYRAEIKKQAEHRKDSEAAEKAVKNMDAAKNSEELQKLREDAQKETIRQLKEELKQSRQATRYAALEVVRNCRKYAAVKMDELSLNQSANPVMWERLACQAQDRVTKFLNGQKYAEAANAKKEQLVYEAMAAEAEERHRKLIRNNGVLQNKVKSMKKDKNVEYNHRYLMERVMYLFRLIPSMSTKWHEDYIGAMEVVERMRQTLSLAGADPMDVRAVLPPWLEFVLRNDNSLATDNRVDGGFMGLTWAQYNELSNFLKNVYTAGRNAKRICSFKDEDGKEISILDATQKMVDESLPRNGFHPGDKGLMDNPTFREKLAKRANELFIMTIKPEELIDRLGATARRLIYEPLKHCWDKEDKMMSDVKARITALFDNYTARKLESMGEKAGKKFLAGIYSENRYKVGRNNLTHEQLLCLALNWGNEKNRQRVCDGYGVDAADIFYALKDLDSADWELVKGFWKLFEDNYDAYNKCIMNTTGVAMGKVEATPFTILGSDGVLHELEGGYYPIVYDRTKSERAEERSLDEAVRSQLGGAQRIGMGIGSSKSRVKGRVMEPVLLSLDGGMQKVQEVVHAICFRETCCDLFKLINQNQDFQTLCTGALGKECSQVLNNWILDSWHSDVRQLNAMDRLMAGVRHNVTSAVLGFRTMTALVNFANVAVAMNYLGPVNYLRAVMNFYRKPVEQWQFVKEKSVFMRDRAESLDRDVREVLKQNPKVVAAGSKVRKGYDWVQEHAFKIIAFTDFIGSAPAWVCAYEAEFRKCVDAGLGADVCEQRAIDAGDAVVRKSYGSGRDVDLAEVQKGGRNRSEAVKMLTMYYSFMSTLHNGMYHAVQEAKRPESKGKDKWLPVLKYGFYAYFLNSLIENIIRSNAGDDGDEDKISFLGKVGLMSADLMSGGFPVVRDIVGSVTRILAGERVMGSRGHAVVQFGDDVVQLLQQLSKGADTAKVLRSVGTITSTATGISKTLLNLPSVAAEFVENGDFSLQDWVDLAEAAAMDKTIKRVKKEDGRK